MCLSGLDRDQVSPKRRCPSAGRFHSRGLISINILCPFNVFCPPASHSHIWRWPTRQSTWKPQESTESLLCRKCSEGCSTGAGWDVDETDFICWLRALHGSSDIPQTRYSAISVCYKCTISQGPLHTSLVNWAFSVSKISPCHSFLCKNFIL